MFRTISRRIWQLRGGSGPEDHFASPPPIGTTFMQAWHLRPTWRTTCRRGATIRELAAVLGLGLVMLAMVTMLLNGLRRGRHGAMQSIDSMYVRGVDQGMKVAAADNQGLIPYPSTRAGSTANAPDTPAALLRYLLSTGTIAAEMLVSPAEANSLIKPFGHSVDDLRPGETVANLERFAATPDDIPGGTRSHCSYAFTPPVGARRASLKANAPATQAMVGNRGPSFEGGGAGEWRLLDAARERETGRKGINSNTLLIHAGRRTWEGNVAYADGHVNFEAQADPPQMPWTFSGLPRGKQVRPDNLFVNENDQTGAAEDEQLRGMPRRMRTTFCGCGRVLRLMGRRPRASRRGMTEAKAKARQGAAAASTTGDRDWR